MATIVTRAGKGSPLTHNEVDANFTNLNSDKIESGDTVASLTLTAIDVADKITHTGDTDTSIRFPAADTVTVETAGSERVRVDSSGRVGIGTSSPTQALTVVGDIDLDESGTGSYLRQNGEIVVGRDDSANFVRLGSSNASDYIRLFSGASERMRIDSSGNVGIGTSSPSEKLSVTGNVAISGSLSKGSGSFKIDHPTKPETHHLVHSFIEGPQADNLYRGKVALVGGTATVNLDEAGRMTEGTFVALNGNVQCFTTNEDGWTAVCGAVDGNILTIEAQDSACTDTVSWLVIGERHDQHMIDANWTDEQGRIITEPEKDAKQ
jgi:hypothetical protein